MDIKNVTVAAVECSAAKSPFSRHIAASTSPSSFAAKARWSARNPSLSGCEHFTSTPLKP